MTLLLFLSILTYIFCDKLVTSALNSCHLNTDTQILLTLRGIHVLADPRPVCLSPICRHEIRRAYYSILKGKQGSTSENLLVKAGFHSINGCLLFYKHRLSGSVYSGGIALGFSGIVTEEKNSPQSDSIDRGLELATLQAIANQINRPTNSIGVIIRRSHREIYNGPKCSLSCGIGGVCSTSSPDQCDCDVGYSFDTTQLTCVPSAISTANPCSKINCYSGKCKLRRKVESSSNFAYYEPVSTTEFQEAFATGSSIFGDNSVSSVSAYCDCKGAKTKHDEYSYGATCETPSTSKANVYDAWWDFKGDELAIANEDLSHYSHLLIEWSDSISLERSGLSGIFGGYTSKAPYFHNSGIRIPSYPFHNESFFHGDEFSSKTKRQYHEVGLDVTSCVSKYGHERNFERCLRISYLPKPQCGIILKLKLNRDIVFSQADNSGNPRQDIYVKTPECSSSEISIQNSTKTESTSQFHRDPLVSIGDIQSRRNTECPYYEGPRIEKSENATITEIGNVGLNGRVLFRCSSISDCDGLLSSVKSMDIDSINQDISKKACVSNFEISKLRTPVETQIKSGCPTHLEVENSINNMLKCQSISPLVKTALNDYIYSDLTSLSLPKNLILLVDGGVERIDENVFFNQDDVSEHFKGRSGYITTPSCHLSIEKFGHLFEKCDGHLLYRLSISLLSYLNAEPSRLLLSMASGSGLTRGSSILVGVASQIDDEEILFVQDWLFDRIVNDFSLYGEVTDNEAIRKSDVSVRVIPKPHVSTLSTIGYGSISDGDQFRHSNDESLIELIGVSPPPFSSNLEDPSVNIRLLFNKPIRSSTSGNCYGEIIQVISQSQIIKEHLCDDLVVSGAIVEIVKRHSLYPFAKVIVNIDENVFSDIDGNVLSEPTTWEFMTGAPLHSQLNVKVVLAGQIGGLASWLADGSYRQELINDVEAFRHSRRKTPVTQPEVTSRLRLLAETTSSTTETATPETVPANTVYDQISTAGIDAPGMIGPIIISIITTLLSLIGVYFAIKAIKPHVGEIKFQTKINNLATCNFNRIENWSFENLLTLLWFILLNLLVPILSGIVFVSICSIGISQWIISSLWINIALTSAFSSLIAIFMAIWACPHFLPFFAFSIKSFLNCSLDEERKIIATTGTFNPVHVQCDASRVISRSEAPSVVNRDRLNTLCVQGVNYARYAFYSGIFNLLFIFTFGISYGFTYVSLWKPLSVNGELETTNILSAIVTCGVMTSILSIVSFWIVYYFLCEYYISDEYGNFRWDKGGMTTGFKLFEYFLTYDDYASNYSLPEDINNVNAESPSDDLVLLPPYEQGSLVTPSYTTPHRWWSGITPSIFQSYFSRNIQSYPQSPTGNTLLRQTTGGAYINIPTSPQQPVLHPYFSTNLYAPTSPMNGHSRMPSNVSSVFGGRLTFLSSPTGINRRVVQRVLPTAGRTGNTLLTVPNAE